MRVFEMSGLAMGAEFSECRSWRYSLWRRWGWDEDEDQALFIALNPSTADETQNDPTVARCVNFARNWGFGGMYMMNAYAWRSTDPRGLKACIDPIGPANDEAISHRSKQCGLVVACWGEHCSAERQEEVLRLIDRPVKCFKKNKSGKPKHPLYMRSDAELIDFWSP